MQLTRFSGSRPRRLKASCFLSASVAHTHVGKYAHEIAKMSHSERSLGPGSSETSKESEVYEGPGQGRVQDHTTSSADAEPLGPCSSVGSSRGQRSAWTATSPVFGLVQLGIRVPF